VLRVTVMNPRTADAHLDALLDGLDSAGRAEWAQWAATNTAAGAAVASVMP
jgi:hypothetical protein